MTVTWAYVVEFLAPPPISPVFQSGGALAGWNEDLTLVGAALVILFLLDRLVVQVFVHPGARYFALHAIVNAIVCVAAWPDFAKVLTKGYVGFIGPTWTMVANSVIASIHIYHCLAFKLTMEDIMHHAVFVTVLCGLAVPYKHVGGALNNFGCFVLSGLPGGVDYIMLVCVKHGFMDKLTEKKWNATVQSWFRSPMMAIYAFNAFQLHWHAADRAAFSPIILAVVGGLHILNGVHYSNQAVENWARHDQMTKPSKNKPE
jgi:hypothetical protein